MTDYLLTLDDGKYYNFDAIALMIAKQLPDDRYLYINYGIETCDPTCSLRIVKDEDLIECIGDHLDSLEFYYGDDLPYAAYEDISSSGPSVTKIYNLSKDIINELLHNSIED